MAPKMPLLHLVICDHCCFSGDPGLADACADAACSYATANAVSSGSFGFGVAASNAFVALLQALQALKLWSVQLTLSLIELSP